MSRVEELEEEIKGLENRKIALLKELEIEKQKTEIEYPSLKMNENYWFINQVGCVFSSCWREDGLDTRRCKIGNFFYTEQEAEKELKKLFLLTRFRQFRDKCNGDWKPELDKIKYYICLKCESLRLSVSSSIYWNSFNMFGYFENKQDAERAIELFGNEIKRLFVEEAK